MADHAVQEGPTARERLNRAGSLKHIDDFVRLKCAPDLLEMGMFPDAKEISESMACWGGVRLIGKKLRELMNGNGVGSTGSEDAQDDAIICVGDGATPRTAALCAYLAGTGAAAHGGGRLGGPTASPVLPPPLEGKAWRFVSIDPIMHYDSASGRCWLDKRSFTLSPTQVGQWATRVRGLKMVRAKIQEVTIRARRAIVVLMHAHVTLADVVAALDLTEGLVGAVIAPCCQWEPHLRHLFGRTADIEWNDPCLLSDKNMMRVWAQAPCTASALQPLLGCPHAPMLDGLVFNLGLMHLERAQRLAGDSIDSARSVPTSAAIAALPRPKDRRLAYKAARRLQFAHSQSKMTLLAADGQGLVNVDALLSDETAGAASDGLGRDVRGRARVGGNPHPGGPTILKVRRGQVERASLLLDSCLEGALKRGDFSIRLRAPTREGVDGMTAPSVQPAESARANSGASNMPFGAGSVAAKAHTPLSLALPAGHVGALMSALYASTQGCAQAGSALSTVTVHVHMQEEQRHATGEGEGEGYNIQIQSTAGPQCPLHVGPGAHAGCGPTLPTAREDDGGTSSSTSNCTMTATLNAPAGSPVPSDSERMHAHAELGDAVVRVENEGVLLSSAIHILTVGVVTGFRILSSYLFYDIHDFASLQESIPVPRAIPVGSGSGLHLAVRSLGSYLPCGAPSVLAALCAHDAAETVAGRHVQQAMDTVVTQHGAGGAGAVVVMQRHAPGRMHGTGAGLQLVGAQAAAAAPAPALNGHSRRSHPSFPSHPSRRLQVCVAKPEKWGHTAEAVDAGDPGGVCPSVSRPPLPSPSSAALLTTLRPGDAVLLVGVLGRGFARHGNFLLFATDGLLLYDSVSRVGADEVTKARAAAIASTDRAGPGLSVQTEASYTNAGQYIRRRAV